jgi:ureidoglycolate lyase
MKIRAEPLTAARFASYGQVLSADSASVYRREFAARLDNRRPAARPNMTVIRAAPAAAPVELREVEIHPHSSQTFVPVNGTRYLVAVCPSGADGEPDLTRLEAFVAEGDQSVNFDRGVWHAPRTVLGGSGDLIMLRWDDGGPEDTVLRALPAAVRVDLVS